MLNTVLTSALSGVMSGVLNTVLNTIMRLIANQIMAFHKKNQRIHNITHYSQARLMNNIHSNADGKFKVGSLKSNRIMFWKNMMKT